MNTDELTEHWTRLRELVDPGSTDLPNKAKPIRETLILHYLPLAETVAKRQHRNLPNHVELDDLIQWANLGLMEAIKNFDPSRNVPFDAYAVRRISGKIVDSLRSLDWAPRGLRAQQRQINAATDKLHSTLDRDPTDHEVAKFLGLEESQVVATKFSSDKATHAYIEENTEATNSHTSDTEEEREMQGYRDLFVDAVKTLPFIQQVIIVLRYYSNKNLTDISKMKHFADVRVGPLHREAVLKIWREVQRNL